MFFLFFYVIVFINVLGNDFTVSPKKQIEFDFTKKKSFTYSLSIRENVEEIELFIIVCGSLYSTQRFRYIFCK